MQPRKLQCCIWRDSIKPSLRFSWFCVFFFSKDNFFFFFFFFFFCFYCHALIHLWLWFIYSNKVWKMSRNNHNHRSQPANATKQKSKQIMTDSTQSTQTKETNEPAHDKTYKMACAPSEDSDQPGHPPSLIRVLAVRMKKAWALSYPLSA